MAITILSTPETLIPETTLTSKWVATDAPVIFNVQRIDNTIASKALDAGKLKVTLQANPNTLLVPAENERIRLYDGANNSFVDAMAYDIAVDKTYFYISAIAGCVDGAYLESHTFDFYVRTANIGYFLNVALSLSAGVSQDAILRRTPNINGQCQIDVSGLLFPEVTDAKVGVYDKVNTAETNQSGQFVLMIGENYDGALDNSLKPYGGEYHYIKAARSKEKGANMYEFVSNLEKRCQFLNYFGTPTHWLGLPFDISFVYSELLAGKSLQLQETHYNSENVQLSQSVTNINSDGLEFVNSIHFEPAGIESTCHHIKLAIITDDAVPPVVENTWYITVSPFSPSNPMRFVKVGNVVTADRPYAGRKMAGSPLPVLDLPNAALIPSVKKDAIYSGTKVLTGFGGTDKQSSIKIYPKQDIYTQFGVEGTLRMVIVSASGAGAYSVHDATVLSTYSSLPINLLANLAFTCASEINTALGSTILHVYSYADNIQITSSDGSAIDIYISSSNRIDFSFTGLSTANSHTATSPISIPITQPLYSIYTDGKIKDGWRIKRYSLDLLSDDYEFVYTV